MQDGGVDAPGSSVDRVEKNRDPEIMPSKVWMMRMMVVQGWMDDSESSLMASKSDTSRQSTVEMSRVESRVYLP